MCLNFLINDLACKWVGEESGDLNYSACTDNGRLFYFADGSSKPYSS